MTVSGFFEIFLTLASTIAATYPIGVYMADVFDNRRVFLTPIIDPIERTLYRLAGVEPDIEQSFPGVPPNPAFNIAISFITNANRQAYAIAEHFLASGGATF